MKITKRQLRRIIKEEKEKLLRESMEELPPPGAGRKAAINTDASDMANVYIQGAVFDGLEEMGLTADQADTIIGMLISRPDMLGKALKAGAEDYKRKLGMTGRPKPRSI